MELYLPVASWSGLEGVQAGYTTRHGGVSTGPYASLNLGYHVGDDSERVTVNRERVTAAFGVPLEQWVVGEQVHGRHVHLVTERDAGRGSRDHTTAVPATDGLVTRVPGLVLTACFADCVPVLFYDPVHRAVGLAHAGWRSTVQGTSLAVLEAMQESFSTRPADCLVAIGPHIGSCCYQVGEDVVQALAAAFPHFWTRVVAVRNGRRYADLGETNSLALAAAGVPEGQITTAGICTACRHDLFYSYRAAGGTTGRFAACIRLV